MFQMGFPSIVRSSKLHIQRQVFVRPILLPAASLAGMKLVYIYCWLYSANILAMHGPINVPYRRHVNAQIAVGQSFMNLLRSLAQILVFRRRLLQFSVGLSAVLF